MDLLQIPINPVFSTFCVMLPTDGAGAYLLLKTNSSARAVAVLILTAQLPMTLSFH